MGLLAKLDRAICAATDDLTYQTPTGRDAPNPATVVSDSLGQVGTVTWSEHGRWTWLCWAGDSDDRFPTREAARSALTAHVDTDRCRGGH